MSPKARKRGHGGQVVEIGANRQSCEPSIILLFKLVLEVVFGAAGCSHGKDTTHREHSIPWKDDNKQEAESPVCLGRTKHSVQTQTSWREGRVC